MRAQRGWARAKDTEMIPASGRKRQKAMPEVEDGLRIAHRVAGLGSLGRPRYVALGACHGGMVAREAKRSCPRPMPGRTASRPSAIAAARWRRRSARPTRSTPRARAGSCAASARIARRSSSVIFPSAARIS